MSAPPESAARAPRRPMGVLVCALVLDLLAFTCILPLFPSLIDFYANESRRDWLYDAFESTLKVFQDAIGAPNLKRFNMVFFGGFLGTLFSALQFVSSPVLGALSDVYGRKPVLLLSVAGSLASYIVWAQSSTFWLFVLSRVVGGLSKASVTIATAIIADLYSENTVGRGMALLGVAFSVGFIVGPTFGAYFSRAARDGLETSDCPFAAAAYFAITLSLLELILIAFCMPETLHSSKRKIQLSDVTSNSALYVKPSALFRFTAVSRLDSSAEIQRMASYGRALFLYLFLYSGLEFTLTFFTHIRFHYDSMQQGRMYLFTGLIMVLLQGGVVRRVAAEKQHGLAVLGIAFIIPAYITIGFAETQPVFYAGLALYAVASGIVVPCLTACVSNLSPEKAKGVTIGVFRCLGALARALGPIVASTVFWLAGPSVCYVIGGLLLTAPVFVLARMKTLRGSSQKQE